MEIKAGESIPETYKTFLDYDPLTGVFVWRAPRSNRVKAGSVAGCKNSLGYIKISLFGRMHSAHRLAWLFVHGEWPPMVIDHINGDRADNRIANLRAATHAQNSANARIAADNTSGLKGVCWNSGHNAWVARIGSGRTRRHLGYFEDAAAAHAAYVSAAQEAFGPFARAA